MERHSDNANGKKGSLVVVGTGINTLAQCSLETKAYIEQAERVLVHIPDPLGMSWIRELNANIVDLQACYRQGGDRAKAYELMVQAIVTPVRDGAKVVAVFYGHPGVFVYPSHEAIRRLRAEGFSAEMRPGISAEDCLFADLGVDPASSGCAQYEATAFLFYQRRIDTCAGLILWQIGVLGDVTLQELQPRAQALQVLSERLLQDYPGSHPAVIYEAPTLPLFAPRMEFVTIASLAKAELTPVSTLYVPALGRPLADVVSLQRLGLDPAHIVPFNDGDHGSQAPSTR